jgi:outer membrane protein insertion porin family
LEKQANNSVNRNFIAFMANAFMVLVLFFSSSLLLAQEGGYDDGKKYILGGIEVVGLQSYNAQTVKTFTGLRVGQPITLPGEEIGEVISKLWDLELFSDINFFITNIEDEKVFLELEIIERPTLSQVTVYGVKPRKVDALLTDTDLKKGKKITESLLANSKNYLQNKYKKEGYLNTKVTIATTADTTETNAQKMVININKGAKVKISEIQFEGNEALSAARLKKALKKTKEKAFYRFWKKSKYIPEDYQTDLQGLKDAYAENGFRDARILMDTFTKGKRPKHCLKNKSRRRGQVLFWRH